MSGVGTLLVGIAAVISSLVSAYAILRGSPRVSDRESQRAAEVAVEVVRDGAEVVVMDPQRSADER